MRVFECCLFLPAYFRSDLLSLLALKDPSYHMKGNMLFFPLGTMQMLELVTYGLFLQRWPLKILKKKKK